MKGINQGLKFEKRVFKNFETWAFASDSRTLRAIRFDEPRNAEICDFRAGWCQYRSQHRCNSSQN